MASYESEFQNSNQYKYLYRYDFIKRIQSEVVSLYQLSQLVAAKLKIACKILIMSKTTLTMNFTTLNMGCIHLSWAAKH